MSATSQIVCYKIPISAIFEVLKMFGSVDCIPEHVIGQERGFRTYGRHRKRVVTVEDEFADIFSTRPCHKHIFSTSSSESGIGPSDSIDSSDSFPGTLESRLAKTKALQRLKKLAQKSTDKENHHTRKTGRLFASDKESCSSSSSDGFTPGSDQRKSTAQQDSRPSGKRNHKRDLTVNRNTTKNESKKRDLSGQESAVLYLKKSKCYTSQNFSEFDDYSLIISDSPIMVPKQIEENQKVIGTSTPRQRSNRDIPHPAINPADISHISPLSNKSDELDENEIVNTTGSPSFCETAQLQTPTADSSGNHFCDDTGANGDSECNLELNLKRLEDSLNLLRVNNRRKKDKANIKQVLDSSVDRQQCSEKDGFYQKQPYWSNDDAIVTECKIHIQRLRDSLLQKNIIFASDLMKSPIREVSVSLFSSPELDLHPQNRKLGSSERVNDKDSSGHQISSFSDSDSDDHSSEDLSAIHEEEESELEEDIDNEDEGEDNSEEYEESSYVSDVENPVHKADANKKQISDLKAASSTIKEADWKAAENIDNSAISGSPVRYMLTETGMKSAAVDEASFQEKQTESRLLEYLDGSFDDERVVGCSSDDSFWSRSLATPDTLKKSCATDASCSLLEILTPGKSKSGAEELPMKERVLQQCGQDRPLPFTAIIPPSALKKCVKIGEGVYGEVFRTIRGGDSVALKIIPIEGNFEVNDEKQKTFEEILPEIVISSELSKLYDGVENSTSNFCRVKSVSCVQGSYPSKLLEQWDLYDEKKKSENDRPDVFGDDQLYIMFEFGDGGCDLDSCKLKNPAQGVSVLRQVACALAVGEEVMQFEHRDLHVGNVLVQPTDSASITVVLNNSPITIDSEGVHVSIIDFTLSRLSKDGCTVYCDLATDYTLFEGKGDYQFEIYRLMKKENKNKWETYHPCTNVLWMHYLCDKLINSKRYTQVGREHREPMRCMREVSVRLLQYSSAAEFVCTDSFFSS